MSGKFYQPPQIKKLLKITNSVIAFKALFFFNISGREKCDDIILLYMKKPKK